MEDRATLGHFAKKTVEKGHMELYQQAANVRSLDGCGGLRAARRGKGEWLLVHDSLIWLRRVTKQWEAVVLGFVLAILLMVFLRVANQMLGLRVPSSIRILA